MTPTSESETPELDAAELVRLARAGDMRAWERLVDQYGRLIWSITHRYKLIDSDAADVAQTTWLRLLEHIDGIRQPDRVGSWIASTARNECLRILAARKKVVLSHEDLDMMELTAADQPALDEGLLAAEQAESVRDALSSLPGRWQRLLEMLMADPPTSYTQISDELGLPIGSIGPTRGRCMARLRVLLQAS